MPIPSKRSGETSIDFTSRCMGDSVMVSEYPDRSQRLAICTAQVSKGEVVTTGYMQVDWSTLRPTDEMHDELMVAVAKADKRDFYKEIHILADRAAPQVRRLLLEAFEQIQDDISITVLERAVKTGNIEEILALIGLQSSGMGTTKLRSRFARVNNKLRNLHEATAIKTLESTMPQKVQQNMSFDITNPKSVEIVREQAGNMITKISGTSRGTIRELVERGFDEGIAPRELARKIKDHIPLTPGHAKAVENFKNMLISEKIPMAQVRKRVEAYKRRLIRWRAENIARTETIRAANLGQQALWEQAADEGLLDRDKVRKKWVITPDDRLCKICRPIPKENTDVPLNSTFQTSVGSVQSPPAHPQCLIGSSEVYNAEVLATSERFYEGIVITIKTAGGHEVTCTPNHPILTLSGWKPAGKLDERDQVVKTNLRERVSFSGITEYEDMPTLISDVCKAFSNSSRVISSEMPLSSEDFHGDAVTGDIAVIRTNIGNLKALRKSIQGLSGDIQVDNITEITRNSFSGHVYNLQTKEELYTSNGIIVHNCRCAMSLSFKG